MMEIRKISKNYVHCVGTTAVDKNVRKCAVLSAKITSHGIIIKACICCVVPYDHYRSDEVYFIIHVLRHTSAHTSLAWNFM